MKEISLCNPGPHSEFNQMINKQNLNYSDDTPLLQKVPIQQGTASANLNALSTLCFPSSLCKKKKYLHQYLLNFKLPHHPPQKHTRPHNLQSKNTFLKVHIVIIANASHGDEGVCTCTMYEYKHSQFLCRCHISIAACFVYVIRVVLFGTTFSSCAGVKDLQKGVTGGN